MLVGLFRSSSHSVGLASLLLSQDNSTSMWNQYNFRPITWPGNNFLGPCCHFQLMYVPFLGPFWKILFHRVGEVVEQAGNSPFLWLIGVPSSASHMVPEPHQKWPLSIIRCSTKAKTKKIKDFIPPYQISRSLSSRDILNDFKMIFTYFGKKKVFLVFRAH